MNTTNGFARNKLANTIGLSYAMAACLMAVSGHAATVYFIDQGDGDWNTAANWSSTRPDYTGTGSVPGASDDAYLDDNQTAGITAAAPSVSRISARANTTLNISGAGSLSTAIGGGALNFSDTTVNVTAGGSLTIGHWIRMGNNCSFVVDASTVNVEELQDQGGQAPGVGAGPDVDTITVRNGATWNQISRGLVVGSGYSTVNFNVEGSGNTVFINKIEWAVSPTGNAQTFTFTMDNTDAALSTVSLGNNGGGANNQSGDNGTQSLVVDVTSWNGVNTEFVLFSYTGEDFDDFTFDNVQFVGVPAGKEGRVAYDTVNNEITLTLADASSGTVVTAEAVDAAAAEAGSDPGTIRISRGAETNGNLDVYYTIGGSADTNDYSEIHTSPITIPDGTNSIDLVFTPVDDSDVEGDSGETIQLTVDTNAAYTVGFPGNGTITIAENDLATVLTIADGNWTNPATWANGTVPGPSQTADINHDIIIDSDVGSVNLFNPADNNTDFITMSNGTLVVTGGTAMNFAGGTTMGLYNGSSFTSAQWYRLGGDVAIIVDGSSFVTDDLQDQGGSDTITVRNGSTFTVSSRYPMGNATTTFSIEGAGNTVYASLDEFGAGGTSNFRFVLDNSDAALSTFQFDTFNLTQDGTRNLIIDATDWNKKNRTFTLFSGTTLTDGGTFDSVQLIGISGGSELITYDYASNRITLDMPTAKGTLFIVR